MRGLRRVRARRQMRKLRLVWRCAWRRMRLRKRKLVRARAWVLVWVRSRRCAWRRMRLRKRKLQQKRKLALVQMYERKRWRVRKLTCSRRLLSGHVRMQVVPDSTTLPPDSTQWARSACAASRVTIKFRKDNKRTSSWRRLARRLERIPKEIVRVDRLCCGHARALARLLARRRLACICGRVGLQTLAGPRARLPDPPIRQPARQLAAC